MRSSRQLSVTAISAASSLSCECAKVRTIPPANFRSSGDTARSSQTLTATPVRSSPERMSHAYSAWSARALPRDSTLITRIQLVEEIGHFQRGDSSIPSLVSMLPPGARHCLLHRITRQQSESQGDLGVE